VGSAGPVVDRERSAAADERTERNRQDQLYVEGVFPFANQRTSDPITGRTAGRYDVPHLADGTLVPALPQSAMGFPNIPGVTYAGLKSTRYLCTLACYKLLARVTVGGAPGWPRRSSGMRLRSSSIGDKRATCKTAIAR
jgi:hypothetical protein